MSDIDKNEPTLLENIRSGYDTFSKGQKRIAGYILDNYVSAAYMTAARLSKETGVSEYSIFWDKETNLLFAVQEQAGDSGSQDLGTNPIVKKWWDYMADIMDVNPDNSPVSIPLKEVFYMK